MVRIEEIDAEEMSRETGLSTTEIGLACQHSGSDNDELDTRQRFHGIKSAHDASVIYASIASTPGCTDLRKYAAIRYIAVTFFKKPA